MIDGSFVCYRGKYAKRLFPRIYHHSRLYMSFFTLMSLRRSVFVEMGAFMGPNVKREAKIRSLASLADVLLLKN